MSSKPDPDPNPDPKLSPKPDPDLKKNNFGSTTLLTTFKTDVPVSARSFKYNQWSEIHVSQQNAYSFADLPLFVPYEYC